MANSVAREILRVFGGFGDGENDKPNLSAINAANYTAISIL
jgi:hypothetical protein